MVPFYETLENPLLVFYSHSLEFPPHIHRQLELIYIVSGWTYVTIHNQRKKMNAGDLAIVFPNIIHSYEPNFNVDSDTNNSFSSDDTILHNTNSCNMIIAIFDSSLTGDFLEKITKFYPKEPFIRADELHSNVAYAMEELEKESSGTCDSSACNALIQLILSRIIPQIDLIKDKEIQNYDITYRIINYISENYMESISLDDLAYHLGVSKYYLSRIFSSKLNTSFSTYLNQIRLNHAIIQLRSTTNTLMQIAIDSGFDSQRTFNRVFKDIIKMTPSQYRKF